MRKNIRKSNKKRIIAYLFVAIFIVIVSCVCALKGQDNWTTEGYGVTSDNQIAIEPETEIRLDFKISEDHFQGIYVRISSRESVFENEILEFALQDKNSGEIISEYSMELKNEVCDSDSLVKLPYENSKGKEVSVYVTGTNIHNIPYLYVSEQFSKDTTMYLNAVKRKFVLVFSGVYMTHNNINYQWFVKGSVLLFLLFLIYFWPVNEADNVAEQKHGHTVSWLQAGWKVLKRIWGKERKIIVFVGVSFLYVCLVLFVYKNYIEDVIHECESEILVENDERASNFCMDADTRVFEQNFALSQDKLSALYYNVKIVDWDSSARIHVRVYDENENICYHDGYTKIQDIIKKGSTWKILLQKEFTQSSDKKAIVYMEPVNFGKTKVMFKTGIADLENPFYQDSEMKTYAPTLKVSYGDNGFLRPLFFLYVIMGYVFLLLIYYLFIIKRASVEQAFIPVTIALGILYMFVIPIYSVPDEYAHIDSAYIVSNRMLGIEAADTFGYEYKRVIDVETEEAPAFTVTLSDYRRLYTSFFTLADDQSLTSCYTKNAVANANILCFLPAALGITIARILGLGTIPLFFLGRLMNLIVSTLLIYLAIRKLPAGKYITMIYATLPIVLQEAASFSYDSIVNAVAIVFVAYCLYFAFDQKEKRLYDIIILLYSLIFMASVKGGVYIPLCFLIFLVPMQQKWTSKKNRRYLFLVTVCIIVSFLQNNIVGLLQRILNKGNSSINPFSGMQMYTFGYLASHPKELVSLFVNTFFTETSRYIYEFFGGKMGSIYNLQMPWMYVIVFLVILLVAVTSDHVSKEITSRFAVVFCGVIVVGSILLVNLSMLIADTSMDYKSIQGVQGRYFIPCILPFILMVNFFMKKKQDVDLEKNHFIYYVTHIVFLFNILMIVI